MAWLVIAPRRSNIAHLHRPWRATLRFCTISLPKLFHSRRTPHSPAASRDGSASRSRASDILDGDVSRLVFLPSPNFDLDMTAESGQKAHQPFEGDFGEFSSQDFRQLGLSGSNPPRGGALGQAERRDCVVQPKDEFGLEKMLFGVRESELQPTFRVGSLAAGVFVIVVLPFP
jgi:hypothetical protein